MQANPAVGRLPSTVLAPAWHYLRQPTRRIASYNRANFRPYLIAGITVAVVALPQAIADLPPEVGLYASIIGGIAAALRASSDHLYSGPTNALSILVLSTLIPFAAPPLLCTRKASNRWRC
jgi:SulP family sulfate permease